MNFLAHIYLSGKDEEVMLGNFTADFVRGNIHNPRNDFMNVGMKLGVALHRQIDFFTDNHPVVRQSIDRLQPRYRKYSGVVVDMYYDHFLAANWSTYSTAPLADFSGNFYRILKAHEAILPAKMGRLIESITRMDWLTNYAHFEGIGWALKGISRRTEFESGIENAVEELQKDYALYEAEFSAFFPEIVFYCQEFLEQNADNYL